MSPKGWKGCWLEGMVGGRLFVWGDFASLFGVETLGEDGEEVVV